MRYWGVDQPREEKQQSELFQSVVDAVNGIRPVEEIRRSIRGSFASGHSVLISEEMFTVTERHSTWREKLQRLGEMLKDLDYLVLVTVREPAEALFSFYVELHSHFSDRGGFMQCALNEDDMRIYHYGQLVTALLKSFEKDKIRVFRFEDIVANGPNDLMNTILPGVVTGTNRALPQRNARSVANNSVPASTRLTLGDMLRVPFRLIARKGSSLESNIREGCRPIVRLLDAVTVRREYVARPRDEDMVFLRAHLKSENQALRETFGIEY